MKNISREKLFLRPVRLINSIKGWLMHRQRIGRLEDYYYNGGKTQKNFSAKRIDRLFAGGLVFLITASLTYFVSQNIAMSVCVGVLGTAAAFRSAKGLRKRKASLNKEKILKQKAVDRFMSMTGGMKPGEFFKVLKDVLEKSGHFLDLMLITDDEGRPVIMTGFFRGERVGIYVKKLKPETMADEKDLSEFVQYCLSRGLKKGIYIADGAFDYSARGYAASLDNFSLYIADPGELYKSFLKKSLLFSMQDLEYRVEQAALEQSYGIQHSLKGVLTFKRVGTYAVLSIIIAVYSVMTPYTLYYMLVSIVLMGLAAMSLIRWQTEKCKADAEKSIRLNSVMDSE